MKGKRDSGLGYEHRACCSILSVLLLHMPVIMLKKHGTAGHVPTLSNPALKLPAACIVVRVEEGSVGGGGGGSCENNDPANSVAGKRKGRGIGHRQRYFTLVHAKSEAFVGEPLQKITLPPRAEDGSEAANTRLVGRKRDMTTPCPSLNRVCCNYAPCAIATTPRATVPTA